MSIGQSGVGGGVAMAVPTEEQNRRRGGGENGEERERLTRFWREARWGVNVWTGRAKFTAQAQ